MPALAPIDKIALPPQPGGRAFLARVVVVAVLLVASVMAANVAIDPRDQWGSPVGIAPVVAADPISQKLALLDGLAEAPRLVILGSSRAAAWPPDSLGPGVPGFNMALSAGTGRDATVLATYLMRTDPGLHHLVVELDAFSFETDRPDRIEGSASADRVLGDGAKADPPLGPRMMDAMSLGVTLDSLRALRLEVQGRPTPQFTYEANGVRHQPAADAAMADGRYDLAAEVARQYDDASLPHWAGLASPFDEAEARQLAQVLHEALGKGVRVQVVLAPYEPSALQRLQGLPGWTDRIDRIKALLVPLCEDGLEFTDATAFTGLPAGSFYDGHHLTPEASRLFLGAVARGEVATACPPR